QAPTGKKETTAYYEIGADEQPEEKTVVACGDMIGRFDEREKIVALAAISKYLADDNESPLKREILEKGLGQDLRFMICKWYQQPYITWQVWNTDPDKITEIRKTVREFLEKTVKEGFDKELFTAGFNRLAFEMRDRDSSGYPRSLEEAVGVLDSWLYGGDPADALEYDGIIDSLEAKIGTGYYEELLKEVLLENGHEAFVTLLPSNTLGKEKIEKEQARLDKESSVWTDSDIERLKKESETLKAWQQAPDSEEALATIPMLKLSDLADKPEAIETRTEKIGGRDLLITENGSKLAYMNLFFSASDTEFDDLKHVSLLCSLLGRLPTEDHDSATLQMLIKKNVGRFGTDIDVFACEKTDRAKVFVTVSAVSLENKVADTLELITEILTKTKYEDVRLVREILNQSALAAQMSLASRGHSFAITRALACNSAHSAAIEATSGFAFAEWLKAQSGASDGEILALLGRIAETAKRIFASARITLSVSSNVKRKDLETFVSSLPKGGNCAEYAFYKPLDVNKEGIVIPAAVGFAAKATNLNLHGRKYSGSLLALTNVLNYEYLWNEIRVQGGAYGCGFRAREDGDVFCYSYRDPKPGNSLSVYDRAKDFIKEFCKDEKDLTRYILGAVADIDPLLNEEQKLAVAEGRFFKGRTYADVCRVYTELLSTTSNDVLGLCDILEDLANDEVYCVAAGEALLDACGEQIEKRISL
ncbi:MAG: hypothetical protein J5793_01880, partial [Clostridia bacterium]|nr:hypothetical protein [Clostridia bacterium]